MIVGIGIDIVDVARLAAALDRTPGLAERLFADGERGLPVSSLAARFAAKEAVAKALGAPAGLRWTDAEVVREHGGHPSLLTRYGGRGGEPAGCRPVAPVPQSRRRRRRGHGYGRRAPVKIPSEG